MNVRRVLNINWHQPPQLMALTGLIGVAGLVLYVHSFSAWIETPVPLLFFLSLSVVAECLYVKLPHASGFVSVGFAICLASLLALGGPATVFVASLGMGLANLLYSSLPLDIVIFNSGQMAITIYVTNLVWTAMGGVPGEAISFGEDLSAIAAAVFTYAMVNVSLVTIAIAIEKRQPIFSAWFSSFRWALPNYFVLGFLGILAATIYRSSLSMFGVFLMWVPFLFARYSFQQYWKVREAHVKTVEALAVALDARDTNTRGHSERVAAYAKAIAKKIKLPDSEVEKIHSAGILHDIGKIAISDLVLNKPGRLSQDEFTTIQQHPEMGADMIRSIGFLQEVADIIRTHHERVDGGGYPVKLSGEKVPLGARIIAVADSFDAMTCDRVYRPRMSAEEAFTELERGKGTQFDAEIVEAFAAVWKDDYQNGAALPAGWFAGLGSRVIVTEKSNGA